MNFRRYYIPNSIVFITQVVHRRERIFDNPVHLELFKEILRYVKKDRPFEMVAYVWLADHFHLMIRPTGTSSFSKIMQCAKSFFTHEYKRRLGITGRMHFWQSRFWDHVIRDEEDFQKHLDYIHYNPIRHGYVTTPEEWSESSFLVWKQRGFYADHWGWSLPDTIKDFDVEGSE